MKLKFD